MDDSHRSPTRRSRLGAGLLAAIAGAALAAGCSSTPEQPLRFPENGALTKSLTLHKVRLILEFDRAYPDFSVVPQVAQRGPATVLDFGSGHVVEVRNMIFHIGEDSYPAGDATLFLFLQREGPWRFVYRGQRIQVEHDGRWKPTLYHRAVETTEKVIPEGIARDAAGRAHRLKAAVKRLEAEELRFDRHVILFRPGSGAWTVDGRPFTPDPGRVLILGPGNRTRLARGPVVSRAAPSATSGEAGGTARIETGGSTT